MYFSYSPQRSSNARIDYQFELSKQRIVIAYRTGKEVTEKIRGDYDVRFHEDNREEYVLDLNSVTNDVRALPDRLLVDCKLIEGDFYIKLLKPYGPEEEHDLTITFPSWNKIEGDRDERSINRQTSLNEFQQLTLLWMDQLAEIKCQTYNLLCYLAEEYKKLSSENPPFPSPISIRSLKTSVFNNVILYIEAIANFLSAIAVNINRELECSPRKKSILDQDDLNKLAEANGKYIRLEYKLVFSAECLTRLIGKTIKINKGDHNWGRFKDFKRKRDSMTHIKILGDDIHSTPSLDNMVASIKITDGDIACSAELLCWFNSLLNEVVELLGSERFPNYHNFNDHIVGLLVNLASSIAGVSNRNILHKYNVESFG